MNRRCFITGIGAAAVTGLSGPSARGAEARQIRLSVDTQSAKDPIPADFPGLGYEISSVAVDGLLNPRNRKYVQLVRTISPEGVIRIGGNTSDFSSWSPDGKAVSLPKATVTNRVRIDELGGFLRATGWKLIWGLNVGTGTPESAADQAAAVAHAAGDRLFCFELGNEPDLFVRGGHRREGFGYKEYHEDFLRFAEILRNRLPDAPLAGPDAAGSPEWVASFARDEGKTIKLLTEHYYRTGEKNPAATMENLLKTDERFVSMTGQLRALSQAAGVPYRLVELNSFSGGGRPGISDTFASALWGLDLMFTLASAGGAGINFETGLNHLGFVSSYSPVFEDEQGNFSARPLYYALLAFRLACGGRLLDIKHDGDGMNLKAYGFRDRAGQLWVALINKDVSTGADIEIQLPGGISSGELWRLTAPAFDSKTGATFAGAEVSAAGTWEPGRRDKVRSKEGKLKVAISAANAVLARLS